MIIYPLPASELDDRTLSKQIENIAYTLCNVHRMFWPEQITKDIPLPYKGIRSITPYTQWARECAANYDYLVKLGLECCIEYMDRFSELEDDKETTAHIKIPKLHKLESVIKWADENRPDLPLQMNSPTGKALWFGFNDESMEGVIGDTTPFPLVMPEKYLSRTIYDVQNPLHLITDEVESYRNYYRSRLEKITNRKELYEHSIFGKGYSLIEELPDGWCELKKIDADGSCSSVGDYRKNLRIYNKPITPSWARRERPEWLII